MLCEISFVYILRCRIPGCSVCLKRFALHGWQPCNFFASVVNPWRRANIYTYIYIYIGQVGRVFANGPEDLGSIPGRIIPKIFKWYLIPPCLTLSYTRYVSMVKWSNPGKIVAPSPTPQCSSYWKGSLLAALDYGRQIIIYIYMYKLSYTFYGHI